MSKRMTSETIIFDTEWLTEADFGSEDYIVCSIDYRAYDTLKIIAPPNVVFTGGIFQEFDTYKLKNFGPDYQVLLAESVSGFGVTHEKWRLF